MPSSRPPSGVISSARVEREAGPVFMLSFWLGDADEPPPADEEAEGGALNEIPEYLMVEEVT